MAWKCSVVGSSRPRIAGAGDDRFTERVLGANLRGSGKAQQFVLGVDTWTESELAARSAVQNGED
jgi:hypothetical protein